MAANAITQWINSKSDQSNVATNSEILKNSKMIEQDLTQILYAIVPMVEALNETEYETSGRLNETLNKIGYLVEFVAASTTNALDELKQEEKEQNEKIVGLLSYEDQGAGALIAAEPETAQKPLMISRESLNELAEIVVPEQEKMTEAITNMGNNVQQITNQTTEIVKNEREAKIDSLVKATEKPKELTNPEKEKKDGTDLSGFLNGVKGMLKKFLSPITWITAFITEILPWVLIFGALFIGFWKTASNRVRMYAVGVFAAILLAWQVLTGKIIKDFKLAITIGKKLWAGAVWMWHNFHIKEFAMSVKKFALEKALAIKKFVLYSKAVIWWKARHVKNFLLQKALMLKTFAMEKAKLVWSKALELKKWTLNVIEHTAKMLTTAKENAMNTIVHGSRIGAVIKEVAMTVVEHIMKLANIVKDFAMSVIRHTADMARIAYGLACELGKFIKELIVTGLKMIHAIALFIADMVRVVFQIAMAAMQYLLIAAAIIAIVALVGLVLYGLVKVIMMIVPMIIDVITSFFKAAWEIVKEIVTTLADFLLPIGKAIIECLASFTPAGIIMSLIKGVVKAIKSLFEDDEEEKQETQQEASGGVVAGGISSGEYNNIEQQKMNLFDAKMNQVLKQLRAVSKAVAIGAIASKVTATFFGVNPSSGQAMPAGTSQFAQTVSTDGVNVQDQIVEKPEEDYSDVLKDIKELLVAIRDKKIEVNTEEKKGGFFSFLNA